jgi:hypothetical protein
MSHVKLDSASGKGFEWGPMESHSNPIELDREFAILPAGPIDDENSYLLSVRPTLGWVDLLDRPRVVILGAAGSGKTTELENAARRLNAQGRTAFFIRLNELAESTLERICRRSGVSLSAWKRDTTPAWFFLDARDELTLTGREFYRALENLDEGLGNAEARARILISSRPTDWKALADRRDFERILPPPQLDASDDEATHDSGPRDNIDESEAVEDTKTDPATNSVLVVQMRPLDEGRILRLASHLGVTDTEAFKRKLHDLDAIPLAGRPGDLIGIANLWRNQRDIKNYEEILRSTIRSSLSDLRRIPGTTVELPVAQYNIGARRLAATMTLARGTAFQYGDAESSDETPRAVRPNDAFTDWPLSHLDAVLRTNLFEPRSLGLIYFHSRAIKEYLAAQWILSIQARSGLSRSELHSILFSEIYGESILIPSMGPTAAWVANQDDYVRAELLSRSPETLLEYGDPEQLTRSAKIQLLQSVISTTLKKGSRLFAQDSRTLRALASPALTGTIRKLWQSSTKKSASAVPRYKDDAHLLLLKLITLGELQELGSTVYRCATSRNNSWIITVLAVRALIALHRRTDLKKFLRYLMRNGRRLDRQLVLSVVQDLYPDYIDATNALRLIEWQEKKGGSVDIEPEHTLTQLVERVAGEMQRVDLLRELIARWTKLGPGSDLDPYEHPETSAARWIVPTILKLTHRILAEGRPISLEDAEIVAVAAAIKHAEDRHDRKEARDVLKSLLDRTGRPRLFWILLDNFKEWHPRSKIKWDLPMKVSILTSWVGLQEADLQSFLDVADKARKEPGFRAALTIWQYSGRTIKTKTRIKKAAGNNNALREIFRDYTQRTTAPELRELRAQNRRIAAQQQVRKERAQKSWLAFRRSLKRNPQLLTDKSRSKQNARFSALFNLYIRMSQKRKEPRSVHARANWPDLIPEYGRTVAKAAARGFKRYWRTYISKLPSELQGIERNQTPYQTLVSLSGLAIEAADGVAWMETLSPAEVHLAVRHAFREINGFPGWFSALTERHPDIVNALVEKEIVFELDDPDQSAYPSILSRLPRQGAEKWPGLLECLLRALRTREASNGRAFGYAIDVLIGSGQAAGSHAAVLYRKKLSLKGESQEHKIGYLAAWFALDGDDATEALYALIRGKPSREKDRIVEEVFARLAGEVRREPIQFFTKNRIRTLERLISLAYLHIRQAEDIQHDGVYSPGRRDNVESGRGYVVKLLIDTPGQDSYRALLRLAEKPHMKSMAEGLRRRAFERARSDSEVSWTPAGVLQYEQEKTRDPQNAVDLFALVQRRLQEIKEDLENGDFSQKALLQLDGTKEEHFQIWLAAQLELRARGFYTAARETEVIERKKPDVVVYRTQVDARIPIEVKVADDWSGRSLVKAFTKQLIFQYQRDRKATHGILLLFGLRESKSWNIGGRRIRGVENLGRVIKESGLRDPKVRGRGITADVVVLRL